MEILLVTNGNGIAVYGYILFKRGFREDQDTACRKLAESRSQDR